jgi:hypothetical protein
MFSLMIGHHSNRPSADFRREFVRRLACHRPYFSRVGVSGKAGAVQGVNLDLSSANETNGPVNGRDFVTIVLEGTDENGPVTVTLGLLKLSDTKSLQLTYWGNKETQGNGSYNAVVDIVKSIKPAG